MGQILFKNKFENLGPVAKNFFDLSALDIDKNQIKMQQFQDRKVLLIVNVACKCGFTDTNYKQLMEIYKEYKSQGLEILGFPCNQFMGQESGTEEEIKALVTDQFGVDFPLFSKIDVNGPNTHEIYKYLRVNSSLHNPKNGLTQEVPWNFTKFLVNKDGKVLNMYGPKVNPNQILKDILPLLK